MAVNRTEESLTECNETLELIDAAEGDDDQQLIPILAEDSPGTQWEFFIAIRVLYVSLV